MPQPSLADPRLAAAAEAMLESCCEAGPACLPRAAGAGAAPPSPAPPPGSGARTQALEEIAGRVAACRACGLGATRTRTVPGEGSTRARVMFVGEAPGADEDRSGRPFVGAAGQLLTRIIEDGMGLQREEVFIANVLKCRPPGNRDPLPEEKAACTPFLNEQLAVLEPELVVALGRHAANHLLGRNATLNSLRGRFHTALELPGQVPVLVTFHPAYLLRNPAAKADCWRDIQLGMQHLGLPVPKPGRN